VHSYHGGSSANGGVPQGSQDWIEMTFSRINRLLLVATVGVSVWSPGSASAQGTPESAATPTAKEICGEPDVGTPESSGATSANPDELDFDLIFLEAMIPHHQTTIDLATVARERSTRPELAAFADQLIDGREIELSAMTIRYMVENPGVGGSAGLEDMGPEHDAEAIAGICSAEDIDLAFIDALIARNSSSMILAGKGADLTTRREVRETALSMAESQQFEIDQMVAWREEWFPDAPLPEHDGG
jgi:uncharacterized protein (DUF305 family)